MSSRNIKIKSVDVQNARGISRRTHTVSLSDLKDINVIQGPNGYGKSTLGLAIYTLLNPGAGLLGDDVILDGVFEDNGKEYDCSVRRRVGRARISGADAEYPEFQTKTTIDHYRLALEDLLTRHDEEFANTISSEMRGGFDLHKVARNLNADRRPGIPRGIKTDLQQANQAIKDERAHQTQLTREESSLEELDERIERLTALVNSKSALEAASEIPKHEQDLAFYTDKLGSFESIMQKLRGGEAQALRGIQRDIADSEAKLGILQTEEAALKSKLDSIDLSNEYTKQSSSSKLTSLKRDQEKLQTLHLAWKSLNKEVEALEAGIAGMVEGVLKECAPSTLLERIDSLDWKGLERVWDEFRSCHNTLESLENRKRELSQNGNSIEELQTRESEALGQLSSLQAWLVAGEGIEDQGKAKLIALGSLGIGLVTICLGVLAIQHHWLWSVGLTAPALIFVFGKRLLSSFQAGRSRKDVEGQCGDGFAGLPSWSEANVEAKCTELLRDAAVSRRGLHELVLLAGVDERIQECQAKTQTAKEKLIEFAEAVGVSGQSLQDEYSMRNLLHTVLQWSKEQQKRPGLEEKIKQAKNEYEQTHAVVLHQLEYFSIAEVSEDPVLDNDVQNVEDLINELWVAQDELRNKSTEVASMFSNVETHTARLKQFNRELGVDEITVNELEVFEERVADYLACKEKKSGAKTLLEDARSRVAVCPELADLTPGELADRLVESQSAGEELAKLREDKAVIKDRVRDAVSKTNLALALDNKKATEQKLMDKIEQSLEAVAAQAIIDWLIEETESENRPKVFDNAVENLRSITGGQMTLHVTMTSDGERFTVSDQVGAERALDQLSVGERVQVLLSVRLAFLSTGEDAALPIVVDEALGTSDDLRAKDIIEALVELAKAGRQIFYFTAQGDEVDKWKEVLDRHDGVEFKLISFAGENGIDDWESRESDGGFLARTIVPQPGEMSHLEYGVALGVERLNAWTFDRGRLSLWYLVDDLDVLYQCWRRNIRTVSLLESHARTQRRDLGDAVLERALGRADALARSIEVFCFGSPRPLSEADVMNSQAFTDKWTTKVLEVVENNGFDAQKVIEALRAKAVARFREDYIDAFEAELLSNRCLTAETLPTRDGILAAGVSAFVDKGIESDENNQWLARTLDLVLGDQKLSGTSDG